MTVQPARSARREARDRIGGRYDPRVLEPSPPAVDDGVWFADDPTARGDGADPVVSPVPTGDLLWEDLCRSDPGLAGWCADRWLGRHRRLQPLPEGFAATREALHRVAFYVLSPARRNANGKIGLRYTYRGFGTPFFGTDRQVRVESIRLVVQTGDAATSARLTTLQEAATAADVALDPSLAEGFDAPPFGDPDAPLDVDEASATVLADWYGFVTYVLEQLRAATPQEAADTRVQIWPEHFDAAIELGDADAGRRASFGGSPGDEHHPEPYLYVATWNEPPDHALFTETHFTGARLAYQDLLAADDQVAAAVEFFETARRELENP